MEKVPCYGVFSLGLNLEELPENPFDVGFIIKFYAIFKKGNRSLTSYGFYDGGNSYRIRFMPDAVGEWEYEVFSEIEGLNGQKGRFVCTQAEDGNHGVARVRGLHFAYDDGTPLYPIGTTCYAWVHQPKELREQTLKTLSENGFKKIRMCVLPKHYDFNRNDPEIYPFLGDKENGFMYDRPNPEFYNLFEEQIVELGKLGIEADLILFHAYDNWGFAKMDEQCNHRYLRYCVARLACYGNVWWSLANEYDLMRHLNTSDWEGFAKVIKETDYADHLLGIHNCSGFYNHSRPWVSHLSLQRKDVYKTTENTNKWIEEYGKPACLDEIGYEGDINWGWGNLTAEELIRRSWECYVRGGYPGHGETYLSDDEVLWWSKGGILKGESPARFKFLAKFNEETGPISYLPKRSPWDVPIGGVEGKVYVAYFGFNRPRFREFYSTHPFLSATNMPDGKYKVEVIDTWNMTIKDIGELPHDKLRIDLPGKQYMAVRLTKLS